MRNHPYLLGLCTVAICLAAATTYARDNYEWSGGRWVQTAKPAEGTAAGELALVRKQFEDEKDKKTVKSAKKFVKRYPDGAGYEEVCMLAGQAEMRRGRFYQAYEWFERQLDQFPSIGVHP